MNTVTQTDFLSALQEIIQNEPGTIRAAVAQEAIDRGEEEITSFFRDLQVHGCVSGMVSSLIYYLDTHRFFDEHYDAIESIRLDYEQAFGEPMTIEGDLKNHLAWYAFETTARELVEELQVIL